MAHVFEIELPDGEILEIEAPASTPVEQLRAVALQYRMQKAGINPREHSGLGGDGQNFLAGMGQAAMSAPRGVGQMLGLIPQEEIDETSARDAALTGTKFGIGGNVAGHILSTIAAGAALKGAGAAAGLGGAVRGGTALSTAGQALLSPTTYKGAMAAGAALGALQPVATGQSRLANTAIGAGAGALGQAIPRAVGGAVRGVRAALDPLTDAGQQRIAADALRRFAANPGAIDAATDSTVPGVQRTLAEATQDQGLAQLQRALAESDPSLMSALTQRGQTNNAARMAALRGIAGDDALRAGAETARDRASRTAFQQAIDVRGVNTGRVVDYLDRILKGRAGNAEVTGTLRELRNQFFDEAGEMVDDVRTLYNVRQSIGNKLGGKVSGDSAAARAASRELIAVRNALDTQIRKVAPSWKRYLDAYREGSRPINQMDVGQEVIRRTTNALDDPLGNPTLSPARYGQAMKSGDQVARAGTGFRKATMEGTMTPQQLQTMGAIRDDLARQAFAQSANRAAGSPTAQNLASQNVLRQTLGPMGIPEGLQAPLNSLFNMSSLGKLVNLISTVYQPLSARSPEQLYRALLDPRHAKQILARLPPPVARQIEQALAEWTAVPLANTALAASGGVQVQQ
jgi:hypothetical protein